MPADVARRTTSLKGPACVMVSAVVLVTWLVLSSPLAAEQKTKPLRDDDVVARVNGSMIYRKSVREVVQGILTLQDTQPDAATVGELARQARDSLIALELLYQESQARGVVVTDAAVDEEIARSKSGFPDAQAFDTAMKAKGMTEADLRRDTRMTMAVTRLLEGSVWRDIQISPQQVKDFYDQNKEEFKHPAQIRVSHILIHVPEKAPAAQRDNAKRQAAGLLAQLKAGADFAQLARQHSQDPSSAALGGDLGYIAAGDMDPVFEKTAFALAPGQVSDVIATPYGFHIIKVTERRDAGYGSLEEVQDRIREVLMKKERETRQAAFVDELRKKSKVELVGPLE
jgi:peptidyl-prolyl cis-trans isomerase C